MHFAVIFVTAQVNCGRPRPRRHRSKEAVVVVSARIEKQEAGVLEGLSGYRVADLPVDDSLALLSSIPSSVHREECEKV